MKRKVFGLVLLGLGAFLLVVGLMTTAWAPGQLKKLPLDVNTTTHLDGIVKKLDPAEGELVENPVKVESITKVDSNASDDEVAVWVNTSCVVIDIDDAPNCVDGDDPRLVSATTDVFATDRVSAEAVGDFAGLPDDAIPHEGLVNKWPFGTEKKDYTYWDGSLGAAVPAVFSGEGTLLGVDCYIYKISVSDAPIEILEGTNGTYDQQIEIWVEPETGSIQQQKQDQQRYLDDGTQVLDLKVSFTEEQKETFADDAKTNLSGLRLLLFWVPLIGFVVGGLCLVGGTLLLLSVRRRRRGGDSSSSRELADAAT